MKRLIFLVVLTMGVLVGLWSCRGERYYTAEGAAWGTVYHITYRCDRELDDSILAVINMVDESLSPFNKSSLLSAVNRGDTVAGADSLLTAVMATSQEVNRWSGGAFDPTVAPLIDLWGFGPKGTPEQAPTQAQIDSALAMVGIAECGITADGRVTKKHPGTQFNFSAIAKGLGCDLVAEMLRHNGCTDFLVEIGGEIVASGVNKRGEAWRVQIDAPVESDGVPVHESAMVVTLTDQAVATSGNYRNVRQYSGSGRVGHTINPVTGRPIATGTLSATVVAERCILADALATACMAMDSRDACVMIEKIPGVGAVLIVDRGGGEVGIVTAGAVPALE